MQTNGQSDSSTPRKKLFAPHLAASGQGGFTLVELLIVSAIITTLVVVAYVSYGKIKELARTSRCMQEIRGMEREISAYTTEKSVYPAGLVDINRDAQRDPWGSLYIYCPPTRKSGPDDINTDYDLFSRGANADWADSIYDPASEDDIFRGRDGAFVGKSVNF